MKNSGTIKYFSILKAIFPRINFQEGRFLKDFRTQLEEYSMLHPGCTYDDIVNKFGTPEDVLSDYLCDQNSDYILSCIKKKKFKWILLIIIVTVAFMCTISFLFFCYRAKESSKNSNIVYEKNSIESEEIMEDE